jgi:hypothetical protein
MNTPETAILDFLKTFPVDPSNNFKQPINFIGPTRPSKVNLSNIEFRQTLNDANRTVYSIGFEDEQGRQFDLLAVLIQDEEIWKVEHGFVSRVGARKISRQTSPSLQLAFSTVGGFYGGGYVSGRFEEVKKLRLVFKEEPHLQTTVQEGIALFATDRSFSRPKQAEFYDQTGKVIAIQNFPDSGYLGLW